MVFLVEMSCLIGRLPITKRECRETNLCHGHAKPVVTPIEKSMAKTAHADDHQHEHGSQADHAKPEHSDHAQGHHHHHSGATEHEAEPISDQAQQLPSCEAHEQEGEATTVAIRIDHGIASLESCCIDDSVRFFSTPTYFQSNDSITTLQVPLIVYCELPRAVVISFEERTASFKPPENETLPTYSRLVRFQVFLI